MTNLLTTQLLAQQAAHTTMANPPAELVPTSLADAYAIQNEIVAAIGPAGAWKVTPMPADGEPNCSPILARNVHPDGATLRSATLPGLSIEVEVAVTIGQALPGKAGGYAPDDVKAAVASLHVVLEVLGSRFHERTAAPRLAGMADLMNNGAVITGPAVAATDWPEFGQQALSLSFDGVEQQTTAAGETTENILAALTWLANHAAGRGLPLKAGDVVITGARLGPIPFARGTVVAEAPGLGKVSATFV